MKLTESLNQLYQHEIMENNRKIGNEMEVACFTNFNIQLNLL